MHERVEALAEALKQQGVGALFGIPGSGLSLQLITAMEKRGIPFYGTSHEAAAAIMAGAFGRQSGRLGCAVSIKGPGLANLLPGILSNWYEQWPMLTVAEAYGPSSALRMHKRLDHYALLQGCTKGYATLGQPPQTLTRLAALAQTEPPGPVHLDLFLDEAEGLFKEGRSRNGHAVPADGGRITRFFGQSRRPVLIVGSLACRSRWAAALAALKIPVFTTLAAKGVLDERLPQAAGVYTGEGGSLAAESILLPKADGVVGIGLRATEVLTPKAFAVPELMLDADCSESDIETVLTHLAKADWGVAETRQAQVVLRSRLCADAWLPGRAFALLQQQIADLDCLVVDTGFFCTVAEHVWQAAAPKAFMASANGRFMGTALPMALGASLAHPQAPVACVVGDGGMQAYPAELRLAAAKRLPLLVILMSDGGYASVASVPAAAGLSRAATTVSGASWFRAVEAMGVPSVRAEGAEAFESALKQWDRRSPFFIEAVFDPALYAGMLKDIR